MKRSIAVLTVLFLMMASVSVFATTIPLTASTPSITPVNSTPAPVAPAPTTSAAPTVKPASTTSTTNNTTSTTSSSSTSVPALSSTNNEDKKDDKSNVVLPKAGTDNVLVYGLALFAAIAAVSYAKLRK